MVAGLDRAEELRPGSGVFELGAVLTSEWWAARAEARHRFDPVWSAYVAAQARAPWAHPLSPAFEVMLGIRARW